MNAVQKIKKKHEARAWADIEGIWRSIKPALSANVRRRREAEASAVYRICRRCGRRWNVSCIDPGEKIYICPICAWRARQARKGRTT